MFRSIFPNLIYQALCKTPINKLNEIRIRVGKAIVLCINGKSYYLSIDGLSNNLEKSIVADSNLIEEIIKRSCENSIYAFEEQIKNGYIVTKSGLRIGLAGEGVCIKGNIKTLKNISSLSIRVPHEVKGCASKIMSLLIMYDFQNTLVLSPPGAGKTTFIRDIIYELSKNNYCYNVLLVDERYEIACCCDGKPTLDVGNFCDVLSGVSKKYGFENGVKNMKPDIIVCDEISTQNDFDAVFNASNSGVKVLCSIHASLLNDLKEKSDFEKLLQNKVFSRFILLSNRDGPGTIEGVFDKDMRCINI